MEAGLKQFLEIYAKDNNLTETEVGMLAGAMSHEGIAKLPEYLKFVNTMNAVAPWMVQYIQLACKKGDSNVNS